MNRVLATLAVAGVLCAVPAQARPAKPFVYSCDLIRQHQETIRSMSSETKRKWIKRLRLSKQTVREAGKCLRG